MADVLVTQVGLEVIAAFGVSQISALSFGDAGILDTFIRADEGPPPAGWSANTSGIFGSAIEAGASGIVVSGNAAVPLTVSKTATIFWPTRFISNQEVGLILNQLPDSGGTVNLYVRLQSGAGSVFSAGYMAVAHFPSVGTVSVGVFRVSGGNASQLNSGAFTANFVASDGFGLDASNTASVARLTVYKFDKAVSQWYIIGTIDDDPVNNSGFVGAGFGKQSGNPGKGGTVTGGGKPNDPNLPAATTGRGIVMRGGDIYSVGFPTAIWNIG